MRSCSSDSRSRARKAPVVLATRYRPLLHRRRLREPMERKVVNTLHEHLLEGMRREAEGEARQLAPDLGVLTPVDISRGSALKLTPPAQRVVHTAFTALRAIDLDARAGKLALL